MSSREREDAVENAKAPSRSRLALPAVIAGVAAILLFWNLAEKDLWQDEAATAVLATRMLKFGRPVAYDGVNLLTTDMFNPEEEKVAKQAGDPGAALAYHIGRGEYKADTTWKWQPWGLFAVAAVCLKLLGPTTFAARLPFALAGLATVLVLFRLVRRFSGSRAMAALAAVFLIANPYWILHARQCRYYPVSSLFLVLTLMAYARWQSGGRHGAAAFAATAWCWFQVDYGTVWPVLAILFGDAVLARRQPLGRVLATGAVLAAAMAPFVHYYELWGRGFSGGHRWGRFALSTFEMNEYVVPAVVWASAVALLAWRWKSLDSGERHLAAASAGIPAALALWIPAVADPALRYAIIAAPAAALLSSWLIVRACGTRLRPAMALATLLIVTPWASLPLHALAPPPDWIAPSPWHRAEFGALAAGIFGHQPDPNRLVIDWLRKHAAPSDEILINYEDVPLMFYLPNPIRGGISAFRAEDDSRTLPRFVILRRSVEFTHWPIFERELGRYRWEQAPVAAPDVPWGNNPDPSGQADNPARAPNLYLARRIGP